MTNLDTYRDKKFVAVCQKIIDDCIHDTPNVKSIILATVDGFEVAASALEAGHSTDKLAAVGSSLFALSSSLAAELKLDACQSLTIDSEKGKVYVRLVESDNKQLILLIQSNQVAMLAHILYSSNKAVAKISEALAQL